MVVRKQRKSMTREKLSWIDFIITEFSFDVKSQCAWSALVQADEGVVDRHEQGRSR